MNNLFFTLIGLLLTSVSIYGQHNFDSISICHNKQRQLRKIVIGEYDVNIQNGELRSFSSHDNAVKYDFERSKFTIKHLTENSILNLTLSSEGVVLETNDTSILLNSPKSIGLVFDRGDDPYALYAIGDFSFGFDFEGGRISKITVGTTGKYIKIDMIAFAGVSSWEFFIESTGHINDLMATFAFGKPELFTISDDENKVGIRLISRKKNGKIRFLEGQKIFGRNNFITELPYRLKYSSGGRLKKNKSRFDLSCVSL
ncbi:MAG: hypothetical protein ACK4E0_17825 [Chitinophagaceae bacterium]